MRGLRKYLTPFAPDQSGAVSVLYELGGILIICDAGGCVGNICGFDEPRWQKKKSAIFSAGLRDMDAIMGRDDLLVEKLVLAAKEIDANFVCIIGTPVPAVIGTDYYALTKMAEKKLKCPVIAVDTNGMELSDKGAEKAYLELVRRFVLDGDSDDKKNMDIKREDGPSIRYATGILGANPLEVSVKNADEYIREYYEKPFIYGADGTFLDLKEAAYVKENIVFSYAGLAAAELLKKKADIPYKAENVFAREFVRKHKDTLEKGKSILIVDDQVAGVTMRDEIASFGGERKVTIASWFSMSEDLKREGDVHLLEEDDFTELIEEGDFDIIIADPVHRKMIKKDITFIEKNSFQISGVLYEACS